MLASATFIDSLSPELAQAERLDLEGRHTEAVDCLVAGVRKNDIEAITRLGKRLLIGDRAPHLPVDGARFLQDATDRGGAEAAALLAVCAAVGVAHAPEPAVALATLVMAAQRGWQPAQAQLRVLAGDADWQMPPGEAIDAGHWRGLADRIDLTAWHCAPPAQDLHGSPLIRSFRGFVSPTVCQWIIEKARGRLTRAMVYDAVIRRTTTHETRTNTSAIFNLLDTDLVCVLVQTRMAASLGLPFRNLEAMTVLHYDPGEQITEHFDFVDPHVPDYEQQLRERGQRIVTFLVYLNDEYAGGETEFPRLDVRHKGCGGEGMFFVNAFADGKPDVRTLHAGRAPTSGQKWIVSQFIKNRPAF
jgi:prolyl 4-hydroxylase